MPLKDPVVVRIDWKRKVKYPSRFGLFQSVAII